MTGRLEGKRAFITGGAQGLGLAFAKAFLAEGAKVIITDIQSEKVKQANEEISGQGGYHHDVTDPDQWASVLARANGMMGGIDVLVHNAGIGAWGSIESDTLESYRKVMAIDCDSVFMGTNAAMPYLKDSQPASVIVISSVAGLKASPNLLAYSTAKAGVAMMSRCIALHCAQAGYDITCNSVHPVFTRTPIIEPMIALKGSQEEGEAALTKNIPLKRLGEPEEVAAIVTYLASNESRFVTGSAFNVDGGITA